ncbi:hypothetical protein BGZ83_009637 [Gryganskiella cystojenkinii]|nr:hypothetical protein BGZ83_009637 [Gryganskiella cystojenkinii]
MYQSPDNVASFRTVRIAVLLITTQTHVRVNPTLTVNEDVRAVPCVLQEWLLGTQGGPTFQDLNVKYTNRWRNDSDRVQYIIRTSIVREYIRFVAAASYSNEQAIRALEHL